MRVPFTWLRSLCDPGLEPRALAERLSMTGTEVERVTTSGAPSSEGFVVGRVLEAVQHPNADRLRVCTVDLGESEPETIVCGAPNVAAGQTVAVARPGAVMPDGTKLGRAKLRGVVSNGMILSETEMEVGEDASGIAVLDGLPGADRPGAPLAGVLPVSETVLELEITPNRPDCLSVFGVAREVHAVTGAPLADAPWAVDAEPSGDDHVSDHASVRVEVPALCPRFTARAFEDVTIGPSPLWLKARLIAAGQRPINNVVDITNYVMLLTGQPLHAFDLDEVPGGEIIVRAAKPGERMTTLDDVERTLDAETVVVADREQPSGIAGIMGGQVSEVSPKTTRVLMEAANWNGTNVLRTSNLLTLRSEASTRFEKGIHPALTMRGQALAARLMIDLCGARLVPGTIDVDAGDPLYEPFAVSVRPSRIDGLLGMEIPAERSRDYLGRLGFEPASDDGKDGEIVVDVPPDRHFDVTREVDLIEEVARVHDLDEHLPATLPDIGYAVGGLRPHQARLRRAEDLLRDAGLDEAITWSFVAPGRGGVPGLAEADPVRLGNPLSEDQSAMRTDLIGGLLAAARHNLARGAAGVALFESGRVYLPEHPPAGGSPLHGHFAGRRPAPIAEPHRIAAIVTGPLARGSWRATPPDADFYDGKGLVELLCEAAGAEVAFAPGGRPFLHPARSAEVTIGGQRAGWVGELHPAVAAEAGAASGVAFEIDAGPLLGGAESAAFEDVTTFPAVSEDLAVVVSRDVPAERVRAEAEGAGGELLRSAEIFDVYEGEQVPEGKRSLALRLAFSAPDRTLTDEEVAPVREAIVSALAEIGATLRG
jgi:phenylalanyl-tRNA synthetase beta chain